LDPKRRLHAPYRVRDGETVKPVQLEDLYDYSDPDVAWYTNAMKNGAGWNEPVWPDGDPVMTTTYSEPFFRLDADGGKVPAGVAHITISTNWVREQVGDLVLGETGYGVVLSQSARFLVHPVETFLRDGISVFQLAEMANDESVRAVAEDATSGRRGFIERDNLVTGQSSWFFYEPIPEAGWSMAVIRIKDEVLSFDQSFRRRVIWTSLCAILGLISLGGWFTAGVYRKRPEAGVLWGLVIFSSIVLLAGMLVIRYVVFQQTGDEEEDSVRIVDQAGLEAFLGSREELLQARHGVPAAQIPTGIFLQSAKFVGASELEVTGYVWQKFTAEMAAGVPRGVTLPGAVQSSFEEAYRHQEGDVETIGWYFRATLRQNLDVSRYPFDHGTVSVRLWSQDFDLAVILVPDLVSYALLNPTSRPGLAEDLVLSGWNISGSYFDYKFVDYRTDFGISDSGQEHFPELQFNVELKRNLVDAILTNMIPVAVVLVMLFAILVTSTKDEEEAKMLGFNPAGVLRITSALFFIVLLAHIQLRSTMQIHEVVFMEYTYILVYLVVIFASLHAFLFTLNRFNFRIIEYQNSLIIKLLYWPLCLTLMLVISTILFY
jgi:hypothetical protein